MITFSLIEVRTEQEKDRLAHLMAYGTDPTKMAFREAQRSPSPPPPRELDRFDECMSKKQETLIFILFNICSGTRSWRKKTISWSNDCTW